jgi:Tol biopolymer transport system component
MRRLAVMGLTVLLALVMGVPGMAQSDPPAHGTVGDEGLIAYESEGDIWVVGLDGLAPRILIDKDDVGQGAGVESVCCPLWSPDGSVLLFEVVTNCCWGGGGFDGRLMALDIASGVEIDLEQGRNVGRCGPPMFAACLDFGRQAWSPDSKHLVIGRSPQALVLEADGSGVREIPSLAALDDPSLKDAESITDLAWSPDGDRIAGIRWREKANEQLVVASIADEEDVTFASPEGCEQVREPVWSPDGSLIAFSCSSAGFGPPFSIGTFDPASGLSETIVEGPGFRSGPVWSTDGEVLMWLASKDGTVSHIERQGLGRLRLPPSVRRNAGSLTAMPDGHHIAVSGQEGIAVLTLDGSADPVWVPARSRLGAPSIRPAASAD